MVEMCFLTFTEHLGLAWKHLKDTDDAIAVHLMHVQWRN